MTKGWLTRLIEGLRGYGAALDPYEMAIIEALARQLDPGSADRLRQRAKAINRVQRLMGGVDTTLYQMVGGRPVFPPETAIVDAPGSIRFARAEVRSADPMSRLKAILFLQDGNLSSIDFDRPSKFADPAAIEEIRVTLLGPPFVDPDAGEERSGWPDPER